MKKHNNVTFNVMVLHVPLLYDNLKLFANCKGFQLAYKFNPTIEDTRGLYMYIKACLGESLRHNSVTANAQ